jgi:hypothetical protein
MNVSIIINCIVKIIDGENSTMMIEEGEVEIEAEVALGVEDGEVQEEPEVVLEAPRCLCNPTDCLEYL